jgi:hypothetical protein
MCNPEDVAVRILNLCEAPGEACSHLPCLPILCPPVTTTLSPIKTGEESLISIATVVFVVVVVVVVVKIFVFPEIS